MRAGQPAFLFAYMQIIIAFSQSSSYNDDIVDNYMVHMAIPPNRSFRPDSPKDDLKDFLITLRRALLMVTRWIEKRYGLNSK